MKVFCLALLCCAISVSGQTAATEDAQWVTDLGGSAGSNKVSLTWTAIDDGNTGTEASYNLRYSTSPITRLSISSRTARKTESG